MATAIGQMTQMPRVPGVTPTAPKPEPGAVYTSEIEKLQPKIEDVRVKRAAAETEAGKLAAEKETFGAEQAVRKAEGIAQAGEQFQKTMAEAPMRPELEEKVKQEKDFFFQPSQRDGMTMATIASFLLVLGTSIGKGGKNNAMAALSGLNGMMEGYRKRSDELYKQEKQQFESNAKALREQIGTLRQALQDYEKQASVDKQGALQKLDIALAQQGADFLKARVQRQGVVNLLPELIRQEKTLDAQISNYEKKRADAQEAARREKERLEFQRQMQAERLSFMKDMQRERFSEQRSLQEERLAEQRRVRQEKADRAASTEKPPPKEIQQLNTNRNILIPALERALPVLDRLNKSGEWTTMTTMLGLPKGTQLAEFAFKDDPEAIELIRTFAKFRAGEFETAGKALTKMENQILAPLFQADFRSYEGIRNAVSQGKDTLKKEQKSLEAGYPWVKKFNESFRSEGETPAAGGGWSSQDEQRLKELEEKARGSQSQ